MIDSEWAKIIRKYKVVICMGSGGVGKTTVSAALAVKAGQMGLRVLVMTIDPSQRLKVILGLNPENQMTVSRVPEQNYKGEIFASLLDAEKIFKEFVLNSSTDKDKAERLTNNRLYQQISTTLSGSQEFTSLLQLSKMVEIEKYDLVILDTPPAQHAIDFLEAPDKINALFKETIVRWFVGENESANIVRKIISRGTRTVLSALEFITGSRFMVELNDFFKSVGAVQAHISKASQDVNNILKASTTGFFLITGFDEAKLQEAEELKKYLENAEFHMAGAIINRAFPQYNVDKNDIHPKLIEEFKQWSQYHEKREIQFHNFSKIWGDKLPVVRIPDLNNDKSGLQGLEVIAHELDIAFTRFYDGRL